MFSLNPTPRNASRLVNHLLNLDILPRSPMTALIDMTVHPTRACLTKSRLTPKNPPVRSKRQAKRAIFSAGRRGAGPKADLASVFLTCNLKPTFPSFEHDGIRAYPSFTWVCRDIHNFPTPSGK